MPPSRFETTEWSLVLAAGHGGEETAAHALARLCALYWYPVFAFVRRKGHAPEDAQDLTQGFFARLIEKGDLGDADRTRGRFRTFLLTACQHYLANEHDRAQTQKRGGGQSLVPIDAAVAERRYQRAFADGETPERLYDRQWALTLLDSVFLALRADYAENGKQDLFDRLKELVTAEEDAGTHAEAAVHRLRRRFREELLKRVADTLGPDPDLEDEIRHLLATLGPARDRA